MVAVGGTAAGSGRLRTHLNQVFMELEGCTRAGVGRHRRDHCDCGVDL